MRSEHLPITKEEAERAAKEYNDAHIYRVFSRIKEAALKGEYLIHEDKLSETDIKALQQNRFRVTKEIDGWSGYFKISWKNEK